MKTKWPPANVPTYRWFSSNEISKFSSDDRKHALRSNAPDTKYSSQACRLVRMHWWTTQCRSWRSLCCVWAEQSTEHGWRVRNPVQMHWIDHFARMHLAAQNWVAHYRHRHTRAPQIYSPFRGPTPSISSTNLCPLYQPGKNYAESLIIANRAEK